jgi:tRNA pseudouridine38-40 synthase
MLLFFEITYHGLRYNGWQTQANGRGVQQVVEEALATVLRKKTPIVGSSRTDTGVHCAQQYFHADLDSSVDVGQLRIRLNSVLPPDIAIAQIRRVREGAHARYDARRRTYRYTISRRKNPLLADRSYHYVKELDMKTLNRAASLLVGECDFKCFSKVKTDVNHFLCDIKSARWAQKGDVLTFTVTANRFLRGMVRAMVGTMLDVGTGKISLKEFQHILKSRDRRYAGANVPARGLVLEAVTYKRGTFLD